DAAHFLAKTYTTRAMYASLHAFGGNEGPKVLDEHHTLLFLVARRRGAIAHRQILQLAFSALIAHGAIERVINKKKLHHAFLRSHRLFGLSVDHHAISGWCCTGGHGLGSLFDFNQAHAAVSSDG